MADVRSDFAGSWYARNGQWSDRPVVMPEGGV